MPSTKTLLVAAAAATMIAAPAAAAGSVYYDAIPDPLPSNVASLGFQAYSTTELGQLIEAESTGSLDTVNVTMSSWACETGAWNTGDCQTTPGATFDHPITVNLFEVDDSGETPAAGELIATVTQTITAPYRPSVEDGCDTGYYAQDLAKCTDGLAFNAEFDFSDTGVEMPDRAIVTIEYNTNAWGPEPIGTPGPYDALNVGIDIDDDARPQPAVGTAGEFFWATNFPGYASELTAYDWSWSVMVGLEYGGGNDARQDCSDWEQRGFRNAGRCIASVTSGK